MLNIIRPKAAKPLVALLGISMLASCAHHPSTSFISLLKPADITWNDTRWCVPMQLKIVLGEISRKFGPVTVWSTFRWPWENERKGGKKKSYHLTCRATDFTVKADPQQVKQFLISHPGVGGYHYYPDKGFFHIDVGPRRTW